MSITSLVSQEQLRQAMRHWTTGVGVTTSAFDGLQHGMTVSSFTSLSLEPPLVMVSLGKSTRTHDLVLDSGVFAVTVLSSQQQEISDRFAGRIKGVTDRFVGVETFTMETGSPLIQGGLAYFDCRVTATHDAGTHKVFIGEVVAVEEGEQGEPLVYFDREYWEIR
jgi:flavin reductase (DIM6/NTAB) family NADH-FMN oxidoreductase RutF